MKLLSCKFFLSKLQRACVYKGVPWEVTKDNKADPYSNQKQNWNSMAGLFSSFINKCFGFIDFVHLHQVQMTHDNRQSFDSRGGGADPPNASSLP
jgi:hypothetical protein